MDTDRTQAEGDSSHSPEVAGSGEVTSSITGHRGPAGHPVWDGARFTEWV